MSSLPTSGNDMDATIAGADSTATPRREPALLVRGASVGRYVVIDRVGRGGMGIVYAAYDPELDRRVAVKLLAPGREGHTDGSSDRIRLLREAQAMAKLAHAHVVAVHDAGTHEGSVFVAMEFVEGGTLGAKMAEHRDRATTTGESAAWRTLLPLFLQAGAGLAAAHAAGLVHRDFKPDNVLVTKDGVAKVSDFGLARALASSETIPDPSLRPAEDALSSAVTRVGAVVGTPAYMAPEQHLQAPTDARSDQFSFCVALYEALYGERPFAGRSLSELAYAVTQGIVADARAGSSVPSHIRKVLLRGLAVEPDARWPSMVELLAALRVDPSRRRTRMLVLGGLGITLAGGAAGIAVLDRHERERCRNEGEAALARWNEDARAHTFATMRATELPYVETTVERVDALLGAYVGRWASARETACLAAGRDPDDEIVALRRACLDERLVHLDVTLDLLATADGAMTAAAVQTVAGLPRLDPCDDEAWLRRHAASRAAGAADPENALAVTRLIALTRAHRPDQARMIAQELLVQTRDDPFLNAEVLRAIGQLEERGVDPAAAVRHLEEAYFLAGTHHNDRTAALAAIDLTMLVGVRMGDLEKGRSWAAHATMMVERDPDPELRHEFLYVAGALESTAGNDDAAIAAFLEQAAIAQQIYGADHPEMGYAHIALGNAYSGGGREDEAREHYERAHTIWERTLGAEHPATITVVFSLGNLAAHDGRIAEGLRLHREVLAVRERIFRPGHIEIGESYSAVGDLLGLGDDHEGALVHHRRALAIHEAHYGPDTPSTWIQRDEIIVDLIRLGRVDEAAPLVEARCVAAEHERAANPAAWVECLAHRGDLAVTDARAQEAAPLLEAAMAAAEEVHGADHSKTRALRHSWARALLEAGDPKRARAQLERVVAQWEDAGPTNHPEQHEAVRLLAEARARAGEPAPP